MDIDQLTGAGGTIEVGGRTLTLHQLNAIEMGKMNAFIKERAVRPMSRFIEEVAQLAPLKEADPDLWRSSVDQLLLQAHEEEKLGAMAEASLTYEQHLEATAYTLWLMCYRDHPDVSYEWMLEKVRIDENPGRLQDKIKQVAEGWQAELAKNGEGPLPKPAPLPA